MKLPEWQDANGAHVDPSQPYLVRIEIRPLHGFLSFYGHADRTGGCV